MSKAFPWFIGASIGGLLVFAALFVFWIVPLKRENVVMRAELQSSATWLTQQGIELGQLSQSAARVCTNKAEDLRRAADYHGSPLLVGEKK